MNDRELLELAAKAAGLEGEYRTLRHSRRDHFSQIRHFSRGAFVSKGLVWDPLNEDGDALRLSCALRISVTHRVEEVRVANRYISATYELVGVDRSAATRRAIVRAAAEMVRIEP